MPRDIRGPFLFDLNPMTMRRRKARDEGTKVVRWKLPQKREKLHPDNFQGYMSPEEDRKAVAEEVKYLAYRNRGLAVAYQVWFQLWAREMCDEGMFLTCLYCFLDRNLTMSTRLRTSS